MTTIKRLQKRTKLLDEIRRLYDIHGLRALSTPFLEKRKGKLYPKLLAAGLGQSALLAELGLTKEYAEWRDANRSYRGKPQQKWSWKVVIEKAKHIVESEGDLPTLEWCRLNGYSSLVSTVFNTGHTWEDLREAVGSFATSHFYMSRNGMRWRSRAEASLSNFLYARQIEHKRGERYPESYAEQSGRLYGRFDMHFRSANGTWIDVEVWGDPLNGLSGGRYMQTRSYKEKFQADNPNFLGIPYTDCLRDARLSEHLRPFIGDVLPTKFDTPQDRGIETSHWTDGLELLESCRQLAATMPGGVFPNEQWLRKRGKFSDRPGDAYHTMAVYVAKWLGGTRNVRKLLGQAEASTTAWTKESAIKAWRDFEAEHGLTPTQLPSRARKEKFPPEIVRRANAIRGACVRLGVIDNAREGKTARKTVWTPDYTIKQWRDFESKFGLKPSAAGSDKNHSDLPHEIRRRASRIYAAANRLGLLDTIRDEAHAIDPLVR
jgi:hypothetical protein